MIIPVRCFTCGKVLADKWNYYNAEVNKNKKDKDNNKFTMDDISISEMKINLPNTLLMIIKTMKY